MNTQTARGRAIATQDAAIASNIAKIEEARRSPTAVESMASRYAMSPGKLQSTLMNTVFKGASEAEFAALIVVSNAYGLNPLTKEIYAFPGKGGITPIVSVDGWTRIMNEHPQFDGIEFNDHFDDNGNLYAIESVIHRRDQTHAIKVTEYMDECKGSGPGWQKVPKRMLRHRALIQGARVAFGFSGIYAEGDEVEAYVQQDGGNHARAVTMPSREQIGYDAETGEVGDEEETARQLDRDSFAAMEGRDDRDTGEAHTTKDALADILAHLARKTTSIDVNSLVASRVGELDDDDRATLMQAQIDRHAELKAAAKAGE